MVWEGLVRPSSAANSHKITEKSEKTNRESGTQSHANNSIAFGGYFVSMPLPQRPQSMLAQRLLRSATSSPAKARIYVLRWTG